MNAGLQVDNARSVCCIDMPVSPPLTRFQQPLLARSDAERSTIGVPETRNHWIGGSAARGMAAGHLERNFTGRNLLLSLRRSRRYHFRQVIKRLVS